MRFGVVSGVGRGMGVLDGARVSQGEGVLFSTQLFPNYFGISCFLSDTVRSIKLTSTSAFERLVINILYRIVYRPALIGTAHK